MARNEEIKARLVGIETLLPAATALADHGPEPIAQDDTFFGCLHGRLELRVLADGRGEQIAYERPDRSGPKTSDYRITPAPDPDSLREALRRALCVTGRVVKRRTLFLVGRTRVHLDRVESLGDFLELEVVLRDGEDAQHGTAEAHELLAHLNVQPSQLVARAYAHLVRDVSGG